MAQGNNQIQPWFVVTDNQMLFRGLKRVGVTDYEFERRSTKTNIEDFKAFFGLEPSTLCNVWHDLQTTHVVDANIYDQLRTKKTTLDDFYIGLYWLKRYRTEKEMKILLHRCEKTIRKWAHFYAQKIQALKLVMIVMPNDFVTIYALSVDGKHCHSKEITHETKKWDSSMWSHKYNTSGVNYEIALCIWTNQVAWVRGPHKATAHDLSVFRDGLLARVPPGKKVIGDSIYTGEECLCNHSSFDSDAVRTFKARVRARHETFNERLARFECLKNCWRGKIRMHKEVFEAIAVLCAYQIRDEEPLFPI